MSDPQPRELPEMRIVGHPESPTELAGSLLRGADASNRRQLIGNTLFSLVGVDPRVFFGDLETLDNAFLETLNRATADDQTCANFDKLIEHINCTEQGSMAVILVNILAPSLMAQIVEDLPG